MEAYQSLAKILRIKPEILKDLDEKMSAVFQTKNNLESLYALNRQLINLRLKTLGLKETDSAQKIFKALLEKIRIDDEIIFKICHEPDVASEVGAGSIVDLTKRMNILKSGYFLKYEKAKEFMLKTPPKNTLSILGYQSAEEMLEKEDLRELYSSLRFLEDENWLNDVFFKQYENLTFNDFEYRPIEIRVLGQKWARYAQKFVAKKYHNISHLKELGLIFVIPVKLGVAGEFLRILALIIHYLNEIAFYNDIFLSFSREEKFSQYFIDALKGKMVSQPVQSDKIVWLIIQQYLAKKDENDWRLFVPHINPEVIHWEKAETALAQMNKFIPEIKERLDFWQDLNWVGDYFKDEKGETLVSFNLIDTVMSLVKYQSMVKYVYHHQEALWNRIFVSYAGAENLERLIKSHWLKGYLEIPF